MYIIAKFLLKIYTEIPEENPNSVATLLYSHTDLHSIMDLGISLERNFRIFVTGLPLVR